MTLTKDQIFSANDLKTVEIEVPEWGGTIKLRTMTGNEREAYFRRLVKNEDGDIPKYLYQTLVAVCAVDDDGKQLFTFDDLPKLGEKNSAVLERLTKEASRVNGLTEESIEDLKGE